MSEKLKVPDEWCCVNHIDIAEINPKFDINQFKEDVEVSFLPMASVKEISGNYDLSQSRKLSAVKKGYTNFKNGDIIFAKITPCMENGKIAVLDNLLNGMGFGSTEFHVSRPYHDINAQFLFYYFVQSAFRKKAQRIMTGSAGQLRVSTEYFKKVNIPIPPLPEQRAIVSKIEQLFSDLDNGIENFKKAQEQLKRYRQSVLKKAFEGELTKKWREEQNDLHSAEELKMEITNKRNCWFDKEILKGNSEAKRLRNKIEKHIVENPDELIPNTWIWTSFLQSCHLVVDCHNKTAPYQKAGIYLVRTSNVRDGKLNIKDNIRYISEDIYKYWSRRCPPESGDILFTREAPMGEAAIIPPDTKICMGQRMMLLRVFNELVSPKYLLYAIIDLNFQKRIRKNAIGTGVKHLRVGDVEKLLYPLCTIKEQHQIVQEIETRLSVCDKMESTIAESLQKAESLRQSILKKAFEGKLLNEKELEDARNAPDWEPAEKLLERIKAEKTNIKTKNKGKK